MERSSVMSQLSDEVLEVLADAKHSELLDALNVYAHELKGHQTSQVLRDLGQSHNEHESIRELWRTAGEFEMLRKLTKLPEQAAKELKIRKGKDE